MRCDNCKHLNVCKHAENMSTLDGTIKEQLSRKEYVNFKVSINCEFYLESSTIIRKADIV